MNWGIWCRKAGIGLLVALGLSAVSYATLQVQGLMDDPSTPAWLAVCSPVALHALGLAQNWLKHRKDD